MAFIVEIIVLLVFLGIGKRISRATGIPFRYAAVCIVLWALGVTFFLLGEEITGKGKVIDIALIIVFPIVFILVIKVVFKFIKWSIGGLFGW